MYIVEKLKDKLVLIHMVLLVQKPNHLTFKSKMIFNVLIVIYLTIIIQLYKSRIN